MRPRNLKAFTLIEVICTLVILGTVAVTVLNMMSISTLRRRFNEQKLITYNLLQRYMEEEVVATSFGNDITGGFTSATPKHYTDFPNYDIWASQWDPASTGIPFNKLKKVIVYVRWKDPYGRTVTEQLETFRANY